MSSASGSPSARWDGICTDSCCTGVRFTVDGLGLGLAGAFFASRLMTALLYETEPTDLTAYAAAVLAVLTSAGIACLLPARRAARSNPVDALRSE